MGRPQAGPDQWDLQSQVYLEDSTLEKPNARAPGGCTPTQKYEAVGWMGPFTHTGPQTLQSWAGVSLQAQSRSLFLALKRVGGWSF